MMAYIPSLHTAPPHYYSSICSNRSSYWIGDSDSEKEENTLMSEPKGTRSSRVDRESRDKRSPEKYQRKFKIGDEVEYSKSDLQNKERSRGKIVEFCKNNFKKYIVRDSKTYVIYTVHEKDLKLVTTPDIKENIVKTIKTAIKDFAEGLEELKDSTQIASDNSERLAVIADDTSSIINDEISSRKVVNDKSGNSVEQDLNCVDDKVKRLEKSIKRLQRERIQQYYTNIGLMCALL